MIQVNLYQLSEKISSYDRRIFKEVKIILNLGH